MGRRMGALLIAFVVVVLGAPPAGARPIVARYLVPPNDPPASIPKNPAFAQSCAFGAFDDSAKCRTATLQAIANARASEGLGPLVLPVNYGSLTHAQQVFTVINIERVDRRLPPVAGLVNALDAAALAGALGLRDPTMPGGYPFTHYGTIFAGGESSVLGSIYDWMYFDGLRGNNPQCVTAASPECWIHRDVILGAVPGNPSSMGVGAALGTYQGAPLPVYAALVVGDTSGVKPAYSFTWAQELLYLTPPPAVRTMTPTSGPAAGGTTVTLTGVRLATTTSLVFGAAGAATNLHPSADGTSLTATAPPSAAIAPVTVTIHSVTGSSTAGTFTYVRSAPSAPRSVKATVPGSGRAAVTWTAPVSNGGTAITGYTVTPLLYGKTPQPAQTVGPTVTTAAFPGLVDGETSTFRVVATNAIGSGAAATSPMVLPPFATLVAFVQRQHNDFAGTAVPDVELLLQVNALTGGARPAGYPAALRRATDATTNVDPVTRLYLAYFQRIPDAGGLTYWIGRKRGGTTLTGVSSAFAASSEFTKKYGTLTNQAFVDLVYQNVLGRAGDAAGVAFWTKQLDSAARNRGEVMVGFSESPEYKTKQAAAVDVAVTWISMLGTSPDRDSFDTWVGDLTTGKKSVADLVAQLLADPAYAAHVA